MMKRIYTIVKSHKPEGQVNVHNSFCMTIPTLAWATSYWAGEQFRDLPPERSHTEVVSLDLFRTEFMGHQWGIPAEFMGFEEEAKKFFNFREICAFTLLHDVPAGRSWRIGPSLELSSALWRLSDKFERRKAEWLPYWRNSQYVTVKPEGTYSSLYRHPKNGVLAVVSNLGRNEVTATAQLNLSRLGLKGDCLIRNALTGEALSSEGGIARFPLGSMEWRILWFQND